MTTARQKVLAHLKKTRAASAREIARALKMSAPNVRHHLGILVSDGRLETSSLNQQGLRGRPEKLYSLSQSALGDNLSVLADALLSVEGYMFRTEEVAGRLLDPTRFAKLPITKRLSLLIEKLDEMRYQARWEAGAEGPRVILGRCPYAKIIAAHPELCRMDAVLLKQALGSDLEQTSKIDKLQGVCIFAMR